METSRIPNEASVLDTLAVLAEVVIPTIAKGVIVRRPSTVALAERLDLDGRAVRRMQILRNTYGEGPLLLRLPVRNQVVLLSPEDVHRVLQGSPDPFSTASSEKYAALSHFQPEGALISEGPARPDRRRFNEIVLGADSPIHQMSEHFLPVVHEEAATLVNQARKNGGFGWPEFSDVWSRVVRRVVFGDEASNDQRLSEVMERLRQMANWAFLHPGSKRLREELFARLRAYMDYAEEGSLVAMMAKTRKTSKTEPAHQIPQWLFAFDPAGMTTMRTLALLATHAEHAATAREVVSADGSDRQFMPYLRGCVLESLRLWPTTPMILRQTRMETPLGDATLPAGTGVLIFANFFHRDDQRLDYAHRFTPEVWVEERRPEDWPLVPFSDGPAICPGRHLVLMLTSAFVADVIEKLDLRLESPSRLGPDEPLPGTLNHFAIRFSTN